MKKLFLFFLITLLLLSSVAAQSNLDLQLEVRLANLERMARPIEITMDAMTFYIGEINGDASNMQSLKSGFLDAKSALRAAKTHPELDAKIQAAGAIVGKFSEEYKSQFNANKGNALVALKKIGDAWKLAKPEFDSLANTYWQVRKGNVLKIFDGDIEGAQKLVEILKNHPNKDRLQAKLDEIKNKRNDLESALISRNDILILKVQSEIGLLAQEFGNLVAGKG